MTLYQFNAFLDDEKTARIWSEGNFVADTKDKDFSILLYQICSFYVEVYYNGQENSISKLRSFSSTSQLEPYLTNIDISDINL